MMFEYTSLIILMKANTRSVSA